MYIEERFKNKTLFREITGVKFETYLKIVSEYRSYKDSTIKTGRPLKISIEDRVLILLLYFKQYFSMSYIAYQYKTSKSCIYYIISDILTFLKSRYEIVNKGIKDGIIIVDATEVKIERPKYNYNFYYSAKRKQFSLKFQVVINNQRNIKDIRVINSRVHDFKLFKDTYQDLKVNEDTLILGDKGYIGINKLHSKSLTPIKRNFRIDENLRKTFNKALGKVRIKIEHINSYFKKFKILGSIYRNSLDLLPIIFNFYSYIYNLEKEVK